MSSISRTAVRTASTTNTLRSVTGLGIVAACALGMLLILGTLGAYSVLARQDQVAANQYGVVSPVGYKRSVDDVTLRWQHTTIFQGKRVEVWPVAGLGHAPVPPGLQRLPRPGEVVVSPALDALLAEPTGHLLKPRLPGRIVGVVRDSGLIQPNELLAYVGVVPSPQQQSSPYSVPADEALVITSYAGEPDNRFGLLLVFCLSVIALLIPIGVLVATASRLASARRDARWAALWLAGCSRPELRVAAAAQALVAGSVGSALGAVVSYSIFAAFRSATPQGLFAPTSFPWVACLCAAVGLPFLAALVTARAMSWSPQGAFMVARQSFGTRATANAPKAIVIGFPSLLLIAVLRGPIQNLPPPVPILLEATAFLIAVVGVAQVTPWIARVAAGRLARRQPTIAAHLASRRVERRPSSSNRVLAATSTFLMLVIFLQGIALLGQPSPESTPALDANQILVTATPDERDTLAAFAATKRIKDLGSTGGGKCMRRYPCQWAVTTDGSDSATERLRNQLGWNSLIQNRDDLTDVAITRRLLPARFQIFSLIFFGILLITAASILAATVDGISTRKQTFAALSAFGAKRTTIAASMVYEVCAPMLLATAIGTVAGVAAVELVATFVRDTIPIPLKAILINTSLTMGFTLAIVLAVLPYAINATRQEQLRTL